MNPFIMGRFSGLGSGFLLDDDIAGIRFVYGSGVGSVTPRQEEEPQDPEDPDDRIPEDANDIAAALDISTGDGDDTVYLYGVSAVSSTTDLGSGDDTMVIIFGRIDSLNTDAGEGEDRLLAIFNRIGTIVEEGFERIW